MAIGQCAPPLRYRPTLGYTTVSCWQGAEQVDRDRGDVGTDGVRSISPRGGTGKDPQRAGADADLAGLARSVRAGYVFVPCC